MPLVLFDIGIRKDGMDIGSLGVTIEKLAGFGFGSGIIPLYQRSDPPDLSHHRVGPYMRINSAPDLHRKPFKCSVVNTDGQSALPVRVSPPVNLNEMLAKAGP